MYERIFQHKLMLADTVRIEAYKKAIQEVVKKGDIVADVGTGSGILAFFAIQAGARRIYAVGLEKIIEEAEKLANINDLEKKIIFIKRESDRINLPEKVDVITSELIGYFGLDESAPKFKTDARDRFLKQGGRLVPSWLKLFLVPVESKALWNNHIGFWCNNFYGFDFSPVRGYAVLQRYVTDYSSEVKQLATPFLISHINFYEIKKMPFVFEGKSIIREKGVFHGLVGYFVAGLSQNVVLSARPQKRLTHWRQTFFPVNEKVMVEEGDEVYCKTIAIPYGGGLFWQWETTVSRKECEVAKFSQSNLNIRKEEFAIRRNDFKPILAEKGEIQRRVLELCNSSRSMMEIAEMLFSEFPSEYMDIGEAFEAVARILLGKVKI